MAATAGPTSFLVLRFMLGVRGSRVLPRHHLLPELLVSRGVPGASDLDSFSSRCRSPMRSPRSSRARSSAWTGFSGCTAGSGCSSWRPCRPYCSPSLVLKYMTDRAGPTRTGSTRASERAWLERRCAPSASSGRRSRLTLPADAGRSSRAGALAIYLFSVTAGYGIVFFLPQIIKALGYSNFMTGVLTPSPIRSAWSAFCCGGTRRTSAGSGAGT